MPSPDPRVLLSAARAARATPELALALVPLLDLTSLSGDESDAEIQALAARATAAGVAALCIPPHGLSAARAALSGTVRLATVANFPGGGDDLAAVADEVAAAVAEGADEIDVVAPLTAIEEGDLGLVGDLVLACRAAATPATRLKLILETGRLAAPELIAGAARTAVMAGVDFLKTSTGKSPTGATLEAVAVLLAVIAEAGGEVGLKVSGGVRTADQAAGYAMLASEVMGREWLRPERFRIGASSLIEQLLAVAQEG